MYNIQFDAMMFVAILSQFVAISETDCYLSQYYPLFSYNNEKNNMAIMLVSSVLAHAQDILRHCDKFSSHIPQLYR